MTVGTHGQSERCDTQLGGIRILTYVFVTGLRFLTDELIDARPTCSHSGRPGRAGPGTGSSLSTAGPSERARVNISTSISADQTAVYLCSTRLYCRRVRLVAPRHGRRFEVSLIGAPRRTTRLICPSTSCTKDSSVLGTRCRPGLDAVHRYTTHSRGVRPYTTLQPSCCGSVIPLQETAGGGVSKYH